MAQLAAGVIGALLLALALPDAMEGSRGARPRRWPAGQGVILEVVLTFVLVFVVFAMAVDPKGLAGIAPAAIGLAVLVNHLVGVAPGRSVDEPGEKPGTRSGGLGMGEPLGLLGRAAGGSGRRCPRLQVRFPQPASERLEPFLSAGQIPPLLFAKGGDRAGGDRVAG